MTNQSTKARKLADVCIAPPLEYMAIDRKTGEKFYFILEDIVGGGQVPVENGQVIKRSDFERIAPEYRGTIRRVRLSECHLCASTGYRDSAGEKVFGGQLVKFERYDGKTLFGFTHLTEFGWHLQTLDDGASTPLVSWFELWPGKGGKITNIGHIHILSGWSDEVRALLEKGEGDDS